MHERTGEPVEALALRRQQHERTPSAGSYSTLRRSAESLGAWELERDAARRVLHARDRGRYVEALLQDGDAETAWTIAAEDPTRPSAGRRPPTGIAMRRRRPM
ncbi:MAG: hypothetical protein ACYCU0_13785 [Solirubrobacteraceae bacterium]